MNSKLLIATTMTGLLLAACAAREPATSDSAALALFTPIHQVLVHPRCVNCHVDDGIPRQYDEHRPHAQNVHGGADGRGVPGLACTACHGERNAPPGTGPDAPPGAPNWHLAPASMVWLDQPLHDVCKRLRSPASNGGKTAAQLRQHFAEDPLVAWGWSPGGRRSLPPLTQDQTIAAVDAWIAAGMPCPEGPDA